eukprot:620239-Rhodomonas_salina.1
MSTARGSAANKGGKGRGTMEGEGRRGIWTVGWRKPEMEVKWVKETRAENLGSSLVILVFF